MVAADARTAITFSLSPGQAGDAPQGRELLACQGAPNRPLYLQLERTSIYAHVATDHLRQVVQQEQSRGGVEIVGLGVGLDLSPYYSRCQVLELPGLPGRATFNEVLALLAGRYRR